MTIATDTLRFESPQNLQASPSLFGLLVRALPRHIHMRTQRNQGALPEFGFSRCPLVQLSQEGMGLDIPGSATTTHISQRSTEGPLEGLLWREFPTPASGSVPPPLRFSESNQSSPRFSVPPRLAGRFDIPFLMHRTRACRAPPKYQVQVGRPAARRIWNKRCGCGRKSTMEGGCNTNESTVRGQETSPMRREQTYPALCD